MIITILATATTIFLIISIINLIAVKLEEPTDEELLKHDPIKYYIKHAPEGAGMKNIIITLDTLNKISKDSTQYNIIRLKISDNRVIDEITGRPFNKKAVNYATCNVYYKLTPTNEYITHTTHQILQINTYNIHTPTGKTTNHKGPNIINIK